MPNRLAHIMYPSLLDKGHDLGTLEVHAVQQKPESWNVTAKTPKAREEAKASINGWSFLGRQKKRGAKQKKRRRKIGPPA